MVKPFCQLFFFPYCLLEVLFFPDDNDVETILMFVLAGYDLILWNEVKLSEKYRTLVLFIPQLSLFSMITSN